MFHNVKIAEGRKEEAVKVAGLVIGREPRPVPMLPLIAQYIREGLLVLVVESVPVADAAAEKPRKVNRRATLEG